MAEQTSNPLTKQVSPRAALVAILSAAVVLVACYFGPSIYRRLSDRPPTTEESRAAIWNYLQKQTGEKDFTVDLSSLTNEVAETSSEPAASKPRKKKLRTQQVIFSKYFDEKQNEAASWKAFYKVIGQELKLAESLLESPDVEQAHTGLALAIETTRYANSPGENPWLAARICEGYLWPNMELADKPGNLNLDSEKILNICEDAFRNNAETNNVVRNYTYIIAKSKGTRVDISRFRLSRVLEDQGKYAEALSYLKQMSNTNKNGWHQRVAALEQKVKASAK